MGPVAGNSNINTRQIRRNPILQKKGNPELNSVIFLADKCVETRWRAPSLAD